jgi:polyphosphate kinase
MIIGDSVGSPVWLTVSNALRFPDSPKRYGFQAMNDRQFPSTVSSPLHHRDLGWLEFNRRVLAEARDSQLPLMERLKFLAIFTSNLDEFFMKRIEILKGLQPEDYRTEEEVNLLARLHEQILPMLAEQAESFSELAGQLRKEGIELLDWEQLDATDRQKCEAFFRREVLPILTPLAVDPSHPFPFLSNLSLSLGVMLRDPKSDSRRFARIKIPPTLAGWTPILGDTTSEGHRFVSTLSLVRSQLTQIFPGMEIETSVAFRITRDAEVELNEEVTDIKSQVYDQLKLRRFEPVVRLEIEAQEDRRITELLSQELALAPYQVFEFSPVWDYTSIWKLIGLGPSHLRHQDWVPIVPPRLVSSATDMWTSIREGDILVHHPYESFDLSVGRFIHEAANDPKVRAIKMTVYRVGDDTPFIDSLVRAAESGKQVAVLFEVRARFDEHRNLQWAAELERAGAHVVYGVMGLKTHSKLSLVVRQDDDQLRCYAHVGTGNYHVRTARLYTDLGLFTCDPTITADVVDLFHFLTGYSRKGDYRELLVSPSTMRRRFLELIDREIANHLSGLPSRIIAKMNQLEDREMIDKLCEASQAGVSVDLLIRGFCCLKPGIEGFSENIRVRSVIGRFLEHSRIFHFADGKQEPAQGVFFIGSADWMERNLSRRVEAIAPIHDHGLKERLWDILRASLSDCRQAWEMQPDGSYRKIPLANAKSPTAEMGTQAYLMQQAKESCVIS